MGPGQLNEILKDATITDIGNNLEGIHLTFPAPIFHAPLQVVKQGRKDFGMLGVSMSLGRNEGRPWEFRSFAKTDKICLLNQERPSLCSLDE